MEKINESQKCDQSQTCAEQDENLTYHLKRIKAIQSTAFNKEKGNLMARVFIRATGAIRNKKGNYIINKQDLFAWFENLDYLMEKTEWDTM